MNESLNIISLPRLAVGLIPALIAIAIMLRWALNAKTGLYAITRMLLQLLVIGYFLAFIFETEQSAIVVLVLAVMLGAACWISMRPVVDRQPQLYLHAFIAISLGGVATLVLVTGFVLEIRPWLSPRHVIPLAGMIFASSMNAVSLAAERLEAEFRTGKSYDEAKGTALNAALIPIINSLFAVGLVSLPGMMTGQILSGTSPLVAARYQIVVMCMLFGASGISAAIYLALGRANSMR
ncbi:MAG: ABC transporter permease [Gammaproteobacteria bacterium]|nr:ABC transporter permease [Gammaproteobacteria bacterium]